MNFELNKIVSFLKKEKLVTVLIIVIIVILILPLPLLQAGNPAQAEQNLRNAEEMRNVAIWLFDNTFAPLMFIIVLLALGIIVTKRRIVVLTSSQGAKKGPSKETIKVALLILILISPIALGTDNVFAQETRNKPLVNKVFIFTLDGTRADTFWSGDHWIAQHKNEGAWADYISSTYPTVTYPNHISIFTGTWPQIHGCELGPGYAASRGYLFLRDIRNISVETIFDVATEYGMLAYGIFAPSPLAYIVKKDNSKFKVYTDKTAEEAIELAESIISDQKSAIEEHGIVMFIHLVDSDETMHQYSTDSPEYRHAIEREADMVGEFIGMLEDLGWSDDSLVIVTADHGGEGYGHFNKLPSLVDKVPFWVWGGPVNKGFKIGGGRLIDIAPTIAFALGIRPPRESIGVVLYRIFDPDVLRDVKGIDDVASLIASEYGASLGREYWDIVFYMGLAVLFVFGFLYAGKIFLQVRKELRKVMSNA